MKLTNEEKKKILGLRIAAVMIDYIIIFLLALLSVDYSFMILSDQAEGIFHLFNLFLLMVFILYLLKDIVYGRSIGKWTIGLEVRDSNNNEKKPNIIKLIVRNLFIFLWPIEILMILFSKDNRRIGDKLANTEVYRISNKINKKRLAIVIGLIIIIFISTTFITVIGTLKNSSSYKIAIESIENNESIKETVGEPLRYGMIPSGSVSVSNGYGEASYVIKVKGQKDSIKVYIYLQKEPNGEWTVKNINYE